MRLKVHHVTPVETGTTVSIPYGAIKSVHAGDLRVVEVVVSIPYGAIKRVRDGVL